MLKKENNSISRPANISRRDFVRGAASAVAAFTIVPSHVLGANGQVPPSDKLNIAGIGAGGKGFVDISGVSSENIVALCDVDDKSAAKTYKKFPRAKKYRDFRKMLDEMDSQIDAVTVTTADHTHFIIAMTAIMKGKHVFCQKPLTHTIEEARRLTEAARKYKVATQMGIQAQASEGMHLFSEWVADGAIGTIREAHAWTDRPAGWWPQAVDRPKETPAVPDTLDWDLFLGPAPVRPYNPLYTPFKWRGWYDYGCGALGDMGCHILDPVFRSLKPPAPVRVQASSTRLYDETYPLASMVTYEFPAGKNTPAFDLKWYDGGLMPPRPKDLEEGRSLGKNDVMLIGDKGTIIMTYGGTPRLLPENKMRAYRRPAKTIERSPGHYVEWIQACKGGKPGGADFDYSGPLTEAVLLGNLAIRTGKRLVWDSKNLKVTNVPEANELVRGKYRKGWEI